ncbi:indole-3-glycerol phosphate synthase [Halopenitus sp. POP-27]|uniref:indole-3-glycerol phosphate synthase n=1 Tax=Halopenitus sp. POP-27 TaxID=2994425 RepID=UPI002468CEC7|nr:indole-3-glycerol phosphate synthase [Halopenitus sp. POP-27]
MDDRMNDLALAVRSILETAESRGAESRAGGDDRVDVDVDPRDLESAFAAVESDGRTPVIAEVKPTSPTTDGTRADDPVDLATEMVAGGAAALSVLTEPAHFGGSTDTLERVREAVDVPVLRKDFLVREAQLDAVESDVVLLIARFLGDDLGPMLAAARDRGFQVLVEVHDRAELERALSAGARFVGINNRDLAKLEVDLSTFEDVAPHAPEDVTLIAESGVTTAADVRRMRAAGADALLIGSAIMDGDVRSNTRRFTTADATNVDDADGTDADDPDADDAIERQPSR